MLNFIQILTAMRHRLAIDNTIYSLWPDIAFDEKVFIIFAADVECIKPVPGGSP